MDNDPAQNHITGDSAVKIASSIERMIRDGDLASGGHLPTVRSLADHLEVSPATVAAAYRSLRTRGLVISRGRRGTRVSPVLAAAVRRPSTVVPAGVVNLADGNPDPALLPDMYSALQQIDPSARLYGEAAHHPKLVALMQRELSEDGVPAGPMCIVSGAMEGIDRVLSEHLRPGDRVAVEDPGFTGILDMVASRGLSLLPVAVDDQAMQPESLREAIKSGAKALIITPRVQSPTGSALTAERARALRRELRAAPDLLVIHDDHARLITSAPLHLLVSTATARWAYIHSFSKALNPDLRLAVVTGDDTTMSRISQRMRITERWVSHILQRIALQLLSDRDVRQQLESATETYDARRQALLAALNRRNLTAFGVSGFNIWLPVREETATVQALAAAGWAVSPGERYRLNAPAGIRITASRLIPQNAERFAVACADVLEPTASATHV